MKPTKFIEMFWEWVKFKFTGKVIIEFNDGGIRGIEERKQLK